MSRLGQHDVGHEGVITGRDGFSLRSSIANPQGVAQPPLQSTLLSISPWHKCVRITSIEREPHPHSSHHLKRWKFSKINGMRSNKRHLNFW
ncbi:hypothetical protein LSPCS325_35290 [Lysinibacillus sp. CTST325]